MAQTNDGEIWKESNNWDQKDKMDKMFQIVIDDIFTKHTFSLEGGIKLVEKMVQLQKKFPKSTITFITITL
jgi:hypothetical protein